MGFPIDHQVSIHFGPGSPFVTQDFPVALDPVTHLGHATRPGPGGPMTLGRRAMFSHHIIAPSKRQAIKEWAAAE